jgi:plasmid stabilization system protein ParE
MYEHLLDRAVCVDDLDKAEHARIAILDSLRLLEKNPLLFRKAGSSAFLRELIVPFGGSGYVLLYEVVDAHNVEVLAVRHQLEDDYH